MSKYLNWRVVFIDENNEYHTTYFRGTDFYSILPYIEKFKDSMKEIVLIEKPLEED